ncbi:MAG: hypothetical protein WA980_15150 [Shinella zoogloeoides]|uniref:hypothetical protein n=1 Tax=Shinella zoogloeoides TaxID=352475 RepID=UPI003C78E674
MDLQSCQPTARCLADHHRLDQIANDRHQPALGLLVGVVAGEEDQLADDDLGIGGIELRPQLSNLLLKILHRLPFATHSAALWTSDSK